MPAFSFIFLCFQPGAVQLFFFTSAMLAFTQGRLLLNNSFRAKLGIHPLVLTPKTPAIDAVIKYATTTNTSTPTDTPSPANPPIQATNVPLGPGGLKLYQPPRPTSSSPSAAPKPAGTPTAPKDVSMIDKYVDKFKAHKEEVMGSLYKMMGTTKEERTKQSRRDKVVRDAESYEKRAALTAERRREERNEKVIGTSGRGRRGGMD